MRKLLASALAGLILVSGLCAGLACGGRGAGSSPVGSSSALPPGKTVPEGTVSSLGFSCDRTSWRVGFTLSRPAGVSAVLDRRTQSNWTHVQNRSPARLQPGPRVLTMKRHRPGHYRVRVRFRTATDSFSRVIEFQAVCTGPPPPTTVPTLPGTTGTLPVQ